ncbi:MAG TPA: isoprenylcysteine carboxylmethyltransferase family protein [Kiritimatiellia bacterium]|jgi:protein-S-isoprenylcysteine O-methyltransferase Ste14
MSELPASEPSPQTRRALHAPWFVASGNFLFRFRNGLFPAIFAVALLLTRPAHFLGDARLDEGVVAAGIILALAGQGFRLMVIGFAYIKRGGKGRKVYADDLVSAGLYAHTRNPMYVGNFLIACGVGLVHGSPAMYALVIPFFAYVYLAITAAEETYLLGKFGPAYEAYMNDVNRFCPDFRGLRRSLAGYRFRWKEVLSKDHGTLFATLSGLVAIVMWKKVWIYGWEASKDYVFTLAWLFLPLVMFYVAVRIFKRVGALRDPLHPREAAA